MPRKLIINAGDRFGRWTIVEERPYRNLFRRFWVKCECGNEKEVALSILTKGHSQSCGCLHREVMKARVIPGGQIRKKLQSVHCAMKARCEKQHHNYFKMYGARGINVCDEWSNSFESFYQWSINNGYQIGLSIDRINNDGNYEPENCRWTTRKVQQNNTRMNRYFTIDGEKLTVTQWGEKMGISPVTIDTRLRDGWNYLDAINTPTMRGGTKRPNIFKINATKRSQP